MKRRRSVAALSLSGPRWDVLTVVLFSIFLFFAMHLWTEQASVWFAFIALVLCIGRTPWRLARERFCVPVIGFLAFMAVYGAAAIYSPFGGSAVRDFRGGLAAFAVAALVLFRFEKRHVRGLLWGLAAVSAVVSLLSTSMACEGPLYDGFLSLVSRFGVDAMYADMTNTPGRVNGVYNDANVTGSIFALGTLISLYLAQTGEKWWKRLLACVLVSMSAVGILLSVSRGAILCFGLSLAVWLIAAGKGQRLRLFLLMVIGAGVSFAAYVPASAAVGPGEMLPNLLAVAGGGGIFLLDWAVGERMAKILGRHVKIAAVSLAVFAVAAVAVVAAALTLTEPYVLGEEPLLYRSAAMQPGEYTLSVDWEGGEDRQVIVYSRSETEALMNRIRSLYNGPLSDVAFTVPEDARRVFFQFWGSEGDTIRSVTISDGTKLATAYKLLPEAIASRLQAGFLEDYSYLVRVQYMKDALKIFVSSPLFGRGLGSTDNLYPTVQPFYYTSRYVHSHILQVMADMGLVGLAAFAVFLGGVLWLLIERLRAESDALAAVLLASWVMVNAHSLMEINFSVQSYQCFAFVLLLLSVVLYGSPLREVAAKAGGAVVCAVFWVWLAVFGGLMGLRQRVQWESDTLRASSMEQLMEALDSYARRDVFDPDPYRLEYVNTALEDTEGLYGEKMLQYVERMRRSGNYPACSGLLKYYYLPAGDFKGLFDCSRACLLQRASYGEIWNEQAAFYRDEVLPAAGEAEADTVAEGVLAFRDLLAEVNQQAGRIEEIVLTEENQTFVDLVSSAVASGLSGEELDQYLLSGGA